MGQDRKPTRTQLWWKSNNKQLTRTHIKTNWKISTIIPVVGHWMKNYGEEVTLIVHPPITRTPECKIRNGATGHFQDSMISKSIILNHIIPQVVNTKKGKGRATSYVEHSYPHVVHKTCYRFCSWWGRECRPLEEENSLIT